MYRKIVLACLFVLLLPASGWTKTVKVAVLPWKVNSAGDMDFVKDAMLDMLTSRLGSNASVEVARPDRVGEALGKGSGAVTDAAALELGRKLSVDYVLYGSLTMLGSSVSLDARLAGVADAKVSPVYSKGTGLDSVVSMADKLSKDVLELTGAVAPTVATLPADGVASGAVEVATGVVGASPAPSAEQGAEGFIVKPKQEKSVTWKSELEGAYSAIAAADLDGDGAKELFIMGPTGLVVARPGEKGLEVLKEFDSATGYANVSVDAVDSDGDGKEEVYLSRVYSNRAASVVIEFTGGAYEQTVSGVGWLARVVTAGGGAPVLVGQRFSEPDGFTGPVVELKKAGGDVVEKGVFEADLPDGTDLYRFDLFDLDGDGLTELVSIDRRNYLRVYRSREKGGWEQEWKSTEFYGGTLNLVAFSSNTPGDSVKKPVAVEGRFFHADTDGDGAQELIIKRNVPGGLGRWAENPASFKSAEVYSLSWDSGGVSRLRENWKTQKVDGYMADFIMDDLDGDGNNEITMLIVGGTEKLFGKRKTYVLSYRVSI